MPRCTALTLSCLSSVVGLSAQGVWVPERDLTSRTSAAVAFDTGHDAAVLFGGDDGLLRSDTWTWNGSAWQLRAPAHRPSPRRQHSMVYDPVQQRVLLFGGVAGVTALRDLWAWDGADWSELVTTTQPLPRTLDAMAFDVGRNRLVYLSADSGAATRVWEYDGLDWTEIPAGGTSPWPAWSPGAQSAYDSDTMQLVLASPAGGVWSWNGVAWSHQAGAALPGGTEVVYDPVGHRLLAIGGFVLAFATPVTVRRWHAATGAWQALANDGPQTTGHCVTFDPLRGEALVVGGTRAGSGPDSSVWSWADGWLRRSHAPPTARIEHTMAADRSGDRLFLFGGRAPDAQGDLWERVGGAWQLAIPRPTTTFPLPPPNPGALTGSRLVWDEARGDLLLVGGDAGPLAFWRRNGALWQRLSFPGAEPDRRANPSVVYDRRRHRVLLFGGSTPSSSSSLSNETWSWDGAQWTELTPLHVPPRGADLPIAYDELRDRVVLVVGAATWEFDGDDWHASAAWTPGGIVGQSLAYDPVLQVVVGLRPDAPTGTAQSWLWDGVAWQVRLAAATPLGSGQVVLTTGDGATWAGRTAADGGSSYDLTTPYPAAAVSFGDSGSTVAGPLLLSAPGAAPWTGTGFGVELAPLPAIALPGLWGGLSDEQWLGVPLPASLAGLGFPGSSLLVALDGSWPMLDLGDGRASATIVVPSTATLAGAVLYLQAFVFEPLSGAITSSNALTMTIGAR